jgi:BASS family bile acid:Na+ symporter
MFVTAIICGLLFGPALALVARLTIPILIVVMTVSLSQMDFTRLLDRRLVAHGLAAGIGLNYLLFAAVWLGLGRLLVTNEEVWAGVVLCAGTPSGAGVVPFTVLLGGDVALATLASLATFVSALLVAPGLVALLADGAVVPPLAVARSVGLIIVLPAMAALGLRAAGQARRLAGLHGPIVNIGFAIIVAALLGANLPIMATHPEYMTRSLVLSIISVPCLALLLKALLLRIGVERSTGVTLIILGTAKNSFLASTVAYSLTGGVAALPGVALSIVTVGFLLVADLLLAWPSRPN